MSKTENITKLISEEQENKNLMTNINCNNNISEINNLQSNLTKKYSIDELNYLKDDLMIYFKQKFEEYSTNLYKNIIKINKIEHNFEEMTKSINSNYNNIIKTQAEMQSELDKIKNYDSFSNNVNDKLISHEVRLNNIREEFSKAIQKYDKIYLDNLELPGFIGHSAKYKNCKIFFNEIIKNLGTLNQFREKNILDLKSYKEKLESIIKSFNILVDNNNQAQIKYINSLKEKNLTDCKNMMNILEEKIMDVKVNNAKYSLDIMKKTEEMTKKWDKIEKIKEEILDEFNYKSDEYKKLNNDTMDKFNEFKKEYRIIRDKFFELADFIKDIRFQKNIKNIYSQILYRKNIKNICKSLYELDDVKNNNKNDEKDLELIKNIASIEKMNFKINKNDMFEKNINISQEITHDEFNESNPNKRNKIKKSPEYYSPYKYNKMNTKDKISLTKYNKTIAYQRSFNNKDIKNLITYNNSSNKKIENENNKEKEDDKNSSLYNNYIKKKGPQKIIIESKFDISLNKETKKPNIEDSNSLIIDNQSTFANNINSNINNTNELNNNNSFSSVSSFCLNYNSGKNNNSNNNNTIVSNFRLDNNDKVIKELASELEQSTAKKDYISKEKANQKIEPKNLVKIIKEEKENLDSSISNKNQDNLITSTDNKINFKNTCNNVCNSENTIRSNPSLGNNKNEFILYGNNPKAIDKKFFLTDKKILDLEEFTKDKFIEIKNQIEKLKGINPDCISQQKTNKSSNIMTFNSYKDKGKIFSNNNKKSDNDNTSFTNSASRKFKFFNQKINENKSERKNIESNKKEFDLTCHNFKKNRLYNLDQISQKIFNLSCKKIKTHSNDEKDKNMISPRGKDYIKNKIVSRNDINTFEQKKTDNNNFYEKKKWETIDNFKKINENKKQNNRNINSGNIYLTQKNGESASFIETDIKLVYLNKFVNNKLPYAPSESFFGEKI